MSTDFVEQFQNALDQLEVDAHRVGENLTSICRKTGISRATPDRWRKEVPKTIQLMADMQRVVQEAKAGPMHAEIDGIMQEMAKGADGTHKSDTGLHVETGE